MRNAEYTNGQSARTWMDVAEYVKAQDAKREWMLKELQAYLFEEVEAGNMTDNEANEWFNMKADQWAQGLS